MLIHHHNIIPQHANTNQINDEYTKNTFETSQNVAKNK